MSLLTFDPQSDRIKLAHRRLSDAYARKAGAEVPVIVPGVTGPVPGFPTLEGLNDLDKLVVQAAAWANGLASTDNDWPPMINTLCGVTFMAEAFGCPIKYDIDGTPWTDPIITDICQVWSLKPVRPNEAPFFKKLNAFVDYAQRKLGTEVPMWTVDIQSPFSVAAHIVEPTELMCACLTDPEAVHHLCKMITEATIEQMQEHIAQMEHPGFPGRNFPSISEPIGVCIADDTPVVMLSPELYREFALPYNSMLGEVFGGIHVHSCGNYVHNLDNLLQITNVRSIQLHAGPGEFPLPATPEEDHPFNRARGKVTMLVDANTVSFSDEYKGRPIDHHADYVLPRLLNGPLTGVILQAPDAGQEMPDAADRLRWTREKLAAAKVPC